MTWQDEFEFVLCKRPPTQTDANSYRWSLERWLSRCCSGRVVPKCEKRIFAHVSILSDRDWKRPQSACVAVNTFAGVPSLEMLTPLQVTISIMSMMTDIKTALLEWSLSKHEDDDDIVGFCQQEAAAAGI